MPSCASSTITSSTSLIISGSSAEVGSSNSIAIGSIDSARAIATRCCWPPESWPGNLSLCAIRPTRSSSLRPLSRAASCGAAEHLDLAERQVLGHRQVREQLEVLEHHADARAQLGQVGLRVADRDAVDDDLALLERLERVDALDERRLAAARGAADHDDLALLRRRSCSRSAPGRCRTTC